MSMFADEYKSGRIEMLRTSPITEYDLLAGKFVGAIAYYMVLVASTLVYLTILIALRAEKIGCRGFRAGRLRSYLGMVLMGCMFVAVGLFFSACTSEQIVAGLSGMITLGVLTITRPGHALSAAGLGPSPPADQGPRHGGISDGRHAHRELRRGSVELGDVVYFLGFAKPVPVLDVRRPGKQEVAVTRNETSVVKSQKSKFTRTW